MNIEEQVLSRYQMAHLMELGVDTSDASMAWMSNSDNPKDDDWAIKIPNEYLEHYNQVPTYTIGDLIYKISNYADTINGIYLSITNRLPFGEWCTCYESKWGAESDYFTSNNILNTLYDCLCWYVEKQNME